MLLKRLFGLIYTNSVYSKIKLSIAYKGSLLALNQFATLRSSLFIVLKIFSILESKIKNFVSSANIIGVSLFEILKRSFIYMRNKSGPRMEPCGTPQVILRHMLFSYLPSDTNCCRSFK